MLELLYSFPDKHWIHWTFHPDATPFFQSAFFSERILKNAWNHTTHCHNTKHFCSIIKLFKWKRRCYIIRQLCLVNLHINIVMWGYVFCVRTSLTQSIFRTMMSRSWKDFHCWRDWNVCYSTTTECGEYRYSLRIMIRKLDFISNPEILTVWLKVDEVYVVSNVWYCSTVDSVVQ